MILNKNTKIYVAGHRGMVGSACWKALKKAGFNNLIGKTFNELDLRNQSDVKHFLSHEKPTVIIDAAAKVGGILANSSYPYDFLMDNMLIQNNLIQSAVEFKIPKFIFLGSSCIYPKLCPQPINENYLLSGPLETTNQWYAIAKISGLKLIEAIKKQYGYDYVSLMPTNLYGPFDNFDLETSHVLPAMIKKFHDSIENKNPVILWGDGSPMREFLHVDDLANAVIYSLLNNLSNTVYNVGYGEDISIIQLSEIMKKIINPIAKVEWDISKPNGTPKKLMDSSAFRKFGWSPSININDGVKQTYEWYLNNLK